MERLILVYAADSGMLSAIQDSAKKLFRLKACSLCSITHGLLGEKEEWKDYTAEIGVPVDYYHRDEIPTEIRTSAGDDLPVILAQVNGKAVPLLSRQILEQCGGSVSALRRTLRQQAIQKNLEIRGISEDGAAQID